MLGFAAIFPHCLTSQFFHSQLHQGKQRNTLWKGQRGPFLVLSQQNWPHFLPTHLPLQQIKRQWFAFSLQLRQSWGCLRLLYTNPQQSNSEKCLHAPSSSHPSLKVLPLQLCPEQAVFLSVENNMHTSPSYLPELHYNNIPKPNLRFWFPPLPACLHSSPPPQQFISNGYSLDYVNAKEVITYTGPGHRINHLDWSSWEQSQAWASSHLEAAQID